MFLYHKLGKRVLQHISENYNNFVTKETIDYSSVHTNSLVCSKFIYYFFYSLNSPLFNYYEDASFRGSSKVRLKGLYTLQFFVFIAFILLLRQIHCGGKQRRDRSDLISAIKLAWSKIEDSNHRSLYNSLLRRMFEVVRSNDERTEY